MFYLPSDPNTLVPFLPLLLIFKEPFKHMTLLVFFFKKHDLNDGLYERMKKFSVDQSRRCKQSFSSKEIIKMFLVFVVVVVAAAVIVVVVVFVVNE